MPNKNKIMLDFRRLVGKKRKISKNIIPGAEKRRRYSLFLRILKYSAIFFLILLAFFFILGVYHYSALRGIYFKAVSGKNNFEHSLRLFKRGDYALARGYAFKTRDDFSAVSRDFSAYRKNPAARYLPFWGAYLNEAEKIVQSARLLSEALARGFDIGADYQEISRSRESLTELSEDSKREILKLVFESTPELNGIKANIGLSLLNFQNIRYFGGLKLIKPKIDKMIEELTPVQALAEKLVPLSQIMPSFFGYPERSSFLAIFQNSDELRPTGGFIGTYGILEARNGDITNFETHDIYHMDMPVKDLLDIAPPRPLADYLGVSKWFMRDANWSPDWPESARKIEWFYKKENELLPPQNRINSAKGDFDGVIAISPEFISDLLEITGPVVIGGIEYNSRNFVDILQYEVEKGYIKTGIPKWQRKEVIGEIAKEIKIRIFDRPISQLYRVFADIDRNLSSKDIMFYHKDPEIQSILNEYNWSGRIKDHGGDYIFVVDANMAALKTDAVIDRGMEYKVEEGANGLFSELNIHYSHTGDFDWKTTRYRSYTRVYAPRGSVLISADGFSGQTETYEEHGKTVFAGFIELEPGAIKNLSLYYKLPENLADSAKNGPYRLYVQKQAGKYVSPLNIEMNFRKPVGFYQPAGFYAARDGNQASWETDLGADREFEVDFSRKTR